MKNIAEEIRASFANLGTDKKLARMVDELGCFSQRFTPRGASKMRDIQGHIDHLNTSIEIQKEIISKSLLGEDTSNSLTQEDGAEDLTLDEVLESLIMESIKFGELCARRDAPLGKTHANFQEWFKAKDFYMTLIFQHGDRLFDRDGDRYRIITVHIAFEAWKV